MIGIANPYVLIGGALALVAALGGAYLQGRSDGRAVMASKAVKQIERVQKAADLARVRVDGAVSILAAAQTQQTTDFREITRETVRVIDRPVYRNVCGDADASKLLDRAHAAANRGLTGAPAFTPAGASEDASQR